MVTQPKLTTLSPEQSGDLRRKVAFLRDPSAYGAGAGRVEAVETHMSWVFLTEREAYKLKKPIRLDGVDFTSLEARRRACADEVRLNRRLAPEVYLGLAALIPLSGGGLALAGEESHAAVDYVVRMRRLPADRLLDRAIERGSAGSEEVARVADLLSSFYLNNPAPAVVLADLMTRLGASIEEAESELRNFPREVDQKAVTAFAVDLRRSLSTHKSALSLRVEAGRVVEGHGDLRPEHVFLGPPPCIIDCLEFDRRLRLLDWSEEVSFLELECERLGAPWIGAQIMARCCERLRDAPPSSLLVLYRSVHAFSRARIAIRHLRDDLVRERGKWPTLTRRYLELAGRCLASP